MLKRVAGSRTVLWLLAWTAAILAAVAEESNTTKIEDTTTSLTAIPLPSTTGHLVKATTTTIYTTMNSSGISSTTTVPIREVTKSGAVAAPVTLTTTSDSAPTSSIRTVPIGEVTKPGTVAVPVTLTTTSANAPTERVSDTTTTSIDSNITTTTTTTSIVVHSPTTLRTTIPNKAGAIDLFVTSTSTAIATSTTTSAHLAQDTSTTHAHCQSVKECAAVVMVAGSGTYQTFRMGSYTKTSLVIGSEQACRPVYAGPNNQYLYFWDDHGAWRIGSNYSSPNAGVMSRSNEHTRCPEYASGWAVWASNRWEVLENLRVTISVTTTVMGASTTATMNTTTPNTMGVGSTATASTSKDIAVVTTSTTEATTTRPPCPVSCPAVVIISGSETFQLFRMGLYTLTNFSLGSEQACRPVYFGPNNQFLYYWDDYGAWRIGGNPALPNAGVTSRDSQRTLCPDSASDWMVWGGGEWTRVQNLQVLDIGDTSTFSSSTTTTTTITTTTTTVMTSPGISSTTSTLAPCPFDKWCADSVVASGSDTFQAFRMGVYTKLNMTGGREQACRPIFFGPNNQYLYYWDAYGAWRIGSDPAFANAGVHSQNGQETRCPEHASGWMVWAEGQWNSVQNLDVYVPSATTTVTRNMVLLATSTTTVMASSGVVGFTSTTSTVGRVQETTTVPAPCQVVEKCASVVWVAGSEAYQVFRMGEYTRLVHVAGGPEQACRPVFFGPNNQYLYYWAAYGAWRIGEDPALPNAGVHSENGQETLCPEDATGWMVWAEGRWNSAANLQVSGDTVSTGRKKTTTVIAAMQKTTTTTTATVKDTPCQVDVKCAAVVVASGSETYQVFRMGEYTKLLHVAGGPEQACRPVFFGPNNQYLYYWAAQGAWRIGEDPAIYAAGVHSQNGEETWCPESATGWMVWAEGKWISAVDLQVSAHTVSTDLQKTTVATTAVQKTTSDSVQEEQAFTTTTHCVPYDCPDVITIFGSDRSMGEYAKFYQEGQACRPIYFGPDGKFLYYWDEFGAWRIGNDPSSPDAGVVSANYGYARCPTSVDGWAVWSETGGNGRWSPAQSLRAVAGKYTGPDAEGASTTEIIAVTDGAVYHAPMIFVLLTAWALH